jgi:hypothetical protein
LLERPLAKISMQATIHVKDQDSPVYRGLSALSRSRWRRDVYVINNGEVTLIPWMPKAYNILLKLFPCLKKGISFNPPNMSGKHYSFLWRNEQSKFWSSLLVIICSIYCYLLCLQLVVYTLPTLWNIWFKLFPVFYTVH